MRSIENQNAIDCRRTGGLGTLTDLVCYALHDGFRNDLEKGRSMTQRSSQKGIRLKPITSVNCLLAEYQTIIS